MKNKLLLYVLGFIFFLFISGCEKKEGPRTYSPDNYEFHDGVAWVHLKEDHFFYSDHFEAVCIDENGTEIFSIPGVRKTSNFYNNIALIDNGYIINKSGKVIHDIVKELDVKIKMMPDNYFDGFIIVEKEVDGVMMTGIVNSDLEWMIEPTAKLNDVEAKGNYLYYNYTIGYFDALKNQFIDEDKFRLRHIRRCFPKSGLLFLSKENNRLHYSSEYTEGEINLEETCETGFYNKDLKMILVLSDYYNVEPLSDFIDGKCLIKFETANKSATHIGLINTEGKFIFIKSGRFIEVKDYDTQKIEFSDCYFDWNGNYFPKELEED